MASYDYVERLRGALALARLVFSTYDKQSRARSVDEWALVLDVLEDSVRRPKEGEESENDAGPRVKCTR